MFKMILSTVVLVAVIGLSSSAPLLGSLGTNAVADAFVELFKPVSHIVGGTSGYLVEGPDGARRGVIGGAAVTDKLGDSIRNTENASTSQQLSAIIGATTGIGLAGLTGAGSTLINNSIDQGIQDSHAVADGNIEFGKGLGYALEG